MELERRGYELAVYSLRRPDLRTLSAESIPLYERGVFLLPIPFRVLLVAHLKYLTSRPFRYLTTAFRMLTPAHRCGKDRIRSLMHFGEGVALASRMETDGITHIHAQYASQPTSVARVIHLLIGIPYSFSAHAHDIWHDRLLLPEKVREATFMVCCSKFGVESLKAEAESPEEGDKIHLVFHGLDIRHFKPPMEPHTREPNLVLSVGRLTEQKGFIYLVEACALLKQNGLDIRCVIVGDGELRMELEAAAKRFGVADRIQFEGAIPQEQILPYYHRASIFCLPCVDTKEGNRDGIPNVLMEAMATGLPVISTTNAGQGELIDNGKDGLLVPPASAALLAKSIKYLCCDERLRLKIGRAARAKMEEKFDNRKTIHPLIELFERHVGSCSCDQMNTLSMYETTT
jgi:colanic acid/amylovoran biosynthesis glycosyltransferase